MKLKINKYEFDVTNKDIVMDNGALYQCITLKHDSGLRFGGMISTIMSKQQFNTMLKNNQLVLLDPAKYPNTYRNHIHSDMVSSVRLYRFNVE